MKANAGETRALQGPLQLAGQRVGARGLATLSGEYKALVLVVVSQCLYLATVRARLVRLVSGVHRWEYRAWDAGQGWTLVHTDSYCGTSS
jgi:hypothetical protein